MNSEKINNDIPLAALGRLSKSEELGLEAALAEDPQLAAELREQEEIITGLWHSAAPLQTMPRAAWGELQERLHDSKTSPRKSPLQVTRWLGGLGWAAALTFGILLLNKQDPTPQEHTQKNTPENSQTISETRIIDSYPGDTEAERKVRERLRKDQQKLATALAERDSATLSSQVIELYRPGESAIESPEVRSQRLLKLLTAALGHDLQKHDEEPVTLIIEEGWLDLALQSLPDDAKIRHRTFPSDRFGDFNLLRSPDGEFFDPVTKFLWKPAPDGGGYLGALAPEDHDLSDFSEAPEIKELEDPASSESLLADSSQAHGYLVRNDNGDAPSFILRGINPTTDTITIRQGNQIASLAPTLPGMISATLGTSTNNLAVPPLSFPTTSPRPQLMEITNPNNQFIWNQPFDIISTDSQGTPSVILTTEP